MYNRCIFFVKSMMVMSVELKMSHQHSLLVHVYLYSVVYFVRKYLNWKHTSRIESWPERLKAMASQVESTHVPTKLRKFVSYHKEFYNLRILLWKYTGASQFLVSQLSITNFCVWSPCRADTFDIIRFQGQHWHLRCYIMLPFPA